MYCETVSDWKAGSPLLWKRIASNLHLRRLFPNLLDWPIWPSILINCLTFFRFTFQQKYQRNCHNNTENGNHAHT